MTLLSQKPPREFVAVLPAAGLGARLGRHSLAKEQLPTLLKSDDGLRLTTPLDYSLDAVATAGVDDCVIVVSPQKEDICKHVLQRASASFRLALVTQAEPLGLAHAVGCALPWSINSRILLCLPDSIFRPLDACSAVCKALNSTGADVMLGVFPTNFAQLQAPVRFERNLVLEILEKPSAEIAPSNTWGIAAWSPRFSALLSEYLRITSLESRPSITHAFAYALDQGLDLRCIYFEAGHYYDLGTPATIKQYYADTLSQ